MNTKILTQSILFKASPNEIYEALMDSDKHSRFTGNPADISRVKGGSFTTWNGYAEGVNLELVQDQKIVQSWRADEECWPESHYSTITIILEKKPSGTKLHFTQEGVPEECYESIKQGWQDYYWKPLKKFLRK